MDGNGRLDGAYGAKENTQYRQLKNERNLSEITSPGMTDFPHHVIIAP